MYGKVMNCHFWEFLDANLQISDHLSPTGRPNTGTCGFLMFRVQRKMVRQQLLHVSFSIGNEKCSLQFAKVKINDKLTIEPLLFGEKKSVLYDHQ